jgi:hypothetical protein
MTFVTAFVAADAYIGSAIEIVSPKQVNRRFIANIRWRNYDNQLNEHSRGIGGHYAWRHASL